MQYVGLLAKYVCHVLIIDYIPFESIMNHQVFFIYTFKKLGIR